MSVRILFADGSRQLSHNLDDRRERWELRKEVTDEIVQEESQHGYEIPHADDFEDYDALLKLYDVYLQMFSASEMRIALTNNRKALRLYRSHMIGLRAEITTLMTGLKAHIKRHNIERMNTGITANYQATKRYALELEDRLLALGGDLPPLPFPGWAGIAERREGMK